MTRIREEEYLDGSDEVKAKTKASTLKAWFEAKIVGPETKAIKHIAREEIKICSTSDSLTG